MQPSVVLTVSIDRPYAAVADYLKLPHNFVHWASGLENLQQSGPDWITQTPQGEMRIRFSEPNDHGIADHWVIAADGTKINVPMRVIANGMGSDVQLTLFRMPAMTDDIYQRDQDWVRKDLSTLKHILETSA
jgi:hypothetical protein